jgi:hypothetical protein
MHGGAADLSPALAALKDCADPTKTSAYAGTEAMNVIDELGPKAAGLLDYIRTMPTNDPGAVARANGYVERLQSYILTRNGLPETSQPEQNAKKKKRAKKASVE